ncbi:hypothetical protein D3C71_1437730 [compost metagenome]
MDPAFRFIAAWRYLYRHIFEGLARQKPFKRILPLVEQVVVAVSKREISPIGSGILPKLRHRFYTVHLKGGLVGPGYRSVVFEQDQPVAEASYEVLQHEPVDLGNVYAVVHVAPGTSMLCARYNARFRQALQGRRVAWPSRMVCDAGCLLSGPFELLCADGGEAILQEGS